LLYHEVVPDDEETLEPGSIPIDLNFDTLYLLMKSVIILLVWKKCK